MLSNAIRGHMAELGIISAKGRNGTAKLLEMIADEQDDRIPAAAPVQPPVTGTSSQNADLTGKGFELLREFVGSHHQQQQKPPPRLPRVHRGKETSSFRFVVPYQSTPAIKLICHWIIGAMVEAIIRRWCCHVSRN